LGDGSAIEWCCDGRGKGTGARNRWDESPRRLLAGWTACLLCGTLTAASLILAFLNGRTLSEFFVEENIVMIATLTVAFSVVGAMIASHRPGNPIGWIFCAAALFQGLAVFGDEYATYALITRPGSLTLGPEMSWLTEWIWAPGLGLILVFLPLLFPDGRPPSRRWRWVAWLGGISIVMIVVLAMVILWSERGTQLLRDPVSDEAGPAWILGLLVEAVAFPLMLVAGLAAVISLFVRFGRARGDERQQIKWFASASALTLGFVFVLQTLNNTQNSLLEAGLAAVALFLIPSIPVATGVAILRYRLYDIDRLINRALVYGLLTAMLAVVYLASVVALQSVLRALTGQESTLAIVASTLAIAAMFNPLRRRIQEFIDRRFYRMKYDARKTLAAFSAKLRDETDLDSLSDELVGVVRETMQPEHVSLWLRAESKRRPR
jgi:hypothetical protein